MMADLIKMFLFASVLGVIISTAAMIIGFEGAWAWLLAYITMTAILVLVKRNGGRER